MRMVKMRPRAEDEAGGKQDAHESTAGHPAAEFAGQPVEQPGGPSRPPYILVIDDNRDIREVVADLLSMEGYAVTAARSGAEALRLAPEWPPAVILLDRSLPNEQPSEVVAALRGRAGWGKTPLLLFTGTDAAALARELGADGVLNKPFDLEDLLTLVARYLALAPARPPETP